MAITRQKKEEILEQLNELLSESLVVVAADNHGLTVEEVTQLRNEAREKGCSVKVAKNRLVKLALDRVGKPKFDEYLTGPTVLMMHAEDPILPAKVLSDFATKHEKLKLKGCLLRDEVMDAAGVERLSKLPGREELQSEFAGLVNTLLGVVYHNANNLFGEFAGLVSARKDQMEEAA